MRSVFRPLATPRVAMSEAHGRTVAALERRGLLRGGLSLGSLVALTGCDPSSIPSVANALDAITRWNDDVQALLFDPNRLAPTYSAAQVLRPPKFNAYYDIMKLKPVDGASWRLEVAGLVENRAPWTIERLRALPQTELIIKHVCVEGWSYIGQWSGVTLRTFLEHVGADLRAPYVAFRTADDYPSSIDMATALHPQTILAVSYGGDVLDDPFGFPVRLRMATKLGYKNPKWLTAIEVTNAYTGGYWEKRGFSWFGGI